MANLQPLSGGPRFPLVVGNDQVVEGYLAVQITDVVKGVPDLINIGDIFSIVFVVDTKAHPPTQ